MNSLMEFMAADHKILDDLFKGYLECRTRDPHKAAPLFSEFRTGLLKHIAWEEEELFPLFRGKAGLEDLGPEAVMRLEHEEIKDLLDSIHKRLISGASNGLREYEGRLKELLKEHSRKEEIVLYPAIDQVLSEAERREVLERLKGVLSLF